MNGVTFGSKHSWRDWELELTNIDIPLPEINEDPVEVPGMDGELDQAEYFGDVTYKCRDIAFSFIWKRRPGDLHKKRQEIANYLHGKRLKVIVDGDPDYYYEGRCRVDTFQLNPATGTIVIICHCLWKLRRITTKITRNLTGTYQKINLHNERRHVVPTITVLYATTVRMNGATYDLSAGTHRVLDFQLGEGLNVMEARLKNASAGTITIEYQEASF